MHANCVAYAILGISSAVFSLSGHVGIVVTCCGLEATIERLGLVEKKVID